MNKEIAKRGYHLSGKKDEFIFMRNNHSIKSRVDFLLDRNFKNETLLQKIRIKFGMVGA